MIKNELLRKNYSIKNIFFSSSCVLSACTKSSVETFQSIYIRSYNANVYTHQIMWTIIENCVCVKFTRYTRFLL